MRQAETINQRGVFGWRGCVLLWRKAVTAHQGPWYVIRAMAETKA